MSQCCTPRLLNMLLQLTQNHDLPDVPIVKNNALTSLQTPQTSLFLPFYDHVFQELDDHLLGCSDRFLAQYFIPSNLSQLSDNRITEVYEAFKDDIPVSAAVYHNEVKRWVTRCSLEDPEHVPSSLQATLHVINPDLYPNIFTALSVLISMSVSTASAERSFSVMRRLKSYLRSRMSTERLSGITMLYVHKVKRSCRS